MAPPNCEVTPRPPAKRHDIYDYKGNDDDEDDRYDHFGPAYASQCPKSQHKMIDTPAPTLTNQRMGEDERRGRQTDDDAWWHDGNKNAPHLRLRHVRNSPEHDASHASSGGSTDETSDDIVRLRPVQTVTEYAEIQHHRQDNIVRLSLINICRCRSSY